MRKYSYIIAPCIVFITALFFYLISMSPTLDYGDGSTAIIRAVNFQFEARATSHPLYHLLNKILLVLPFGTPAWRVNLTSVIPAALCLTVLFCLIRNLKIHIIANIVGIVAFGLSHTFWLKASVTDVYALQDFLAALTFYFILKWKISAENSDGHEVYWISLWAVSWGMSLMHHFLIAFMLPSQILFVILNRKYIKSYVQFITIFICSFFIISFTWWYIAVMQVLNGESIISICTGGGGVESKLWGYTFLALPKAIIFSIMIFAYQFPWLLMPAGIYGCYIQKKRENHSLFYIFFIAFIINITFAITYRSHHKYEVFSQSYMIFTIWIAYAINFILKQYSRHNKIIITTAIISLLLQPISYFITVRFLVTHPQLQPIHIRPVPFRNNTRHFFWPPKTGYYGAEKYGHEVMKQLPKNAVIIADWTLFTVLEHMQQIEHLRPDVTLLFLEHEGVQKVIQKYKHRSIFTAADLPEYGLNKLSKQYIVKKNSLVYKIIMKK